MPIGGAPRSRGSGVHLVGGFLRSSWHGLDSNFPLPLLEGDHISAVTSPRHHRKDKISQAFFVVSFWMRCKHRVTPVDRKISPSLPIGWGDVISDALFSAEPVRYLCRHHLSISAEQPPPNHIF